MIMIICLYLHQPTIKTITKPKPNSQILDLNYCGYIYQDIGIWIHKGISCVYVILIQGICTSSHLEAAREKNWSYQDEIDDRIEA